MRRKRRTAGSDDGQRRPSAPVLRPVRHPVDVAVRCPEVDPAALPVVFHPRSAEDLDTGLAQLLHRGLKVVDEKFRYRPGGELEVVDVVRAEDLELRRVRHPAPSKPGGDLLQIDAEQVAKEGERLGERRRSCPHPDDAVNLHRRLLYAAAGFHSMCSIVTTGSWRPAISSYFPKYGMRSTCCANRRSRSAPSATVARPWNVSVPTS